MKLTFTKVMAALITIIVIGSNTAFFPAPQRPSVPGRDCAVCATSDEPSFPSDFIEEYKD